MAVKFLYPVSRKFLFDETCETIVRQLELRDWNVPGVVVDFYDYGKGEEKYRRVQSVRGENFYLRFSRMQGMIPNSNYNDTAAVNQLTIPKRQLCVYLNEHLPHFYTYVGKDWEKDKNDFFFTPKIHSKLDQKPRTYLMYNGIYRFGVPILEHTNDNGQEYDLVFGDRPTYGMDNVFFEFDQWLVRNVLNHILEYEVVAKPEKTLEQLKAQQNLTKMYTVVSWRDALKINSIKKRTNVHKSEKFGLIPSHRLIYLDYCEDTALPKISEGSVWFHLGDLKEVSNVEEILAYDFRFTYPDYLVQITLNNHDNVYIADLTDGKKYRNFILQNNPFEEGLTVEQYEEFLDILQKTIMPVGNYCGDYEQPIILVDRGLDPDEIEIFACIERDKTINTKFSLGS